MADVNPFHEDGTPKSPEELAAEEAQGSSNTAPGSKTDSALLLESLRIEREKRRELENELETLKATSGSPSVTTDEGIALERQIQENNRKIDLLTRENAKKDLLLSHPVLSEKWAEFETFQADPENAGMPLKTAAKAFLIENSLLDAPRKGLERPTGGERVPPSTKMTVEDVKILRETNYKKYTEMVEKGLINV